MIFLPIWPRLFSSKILSKLGLLPWVHQWIIPLFLKMKALRHSWLHGLQTGAPCTALHDFDDGSPPTSDFRSKWEIYSIKTKLESWFLYIWTCLQILGDQFTLLEVHLNVDWSFKLIEDLCMLIMGHHIIDWSGTQKTGVLCEGFMRLR
ncbi:uncharacterized protein LOC120122096 [Hibiscus syriacus]|uniref:uncharacterized protein LOC120122096 n=1 Tax=Hibiscus syriacus TaxID=106335 RepID=UPI00192274D7|nr:uncharacterized protein LOC120122096 [Hibiscus syriacus]